MKADFVVRLFVYQICGFLKEHILTFYGDLSYELAHPEGHPSLSVLGVNAGRSSQSQHSSHSTTLLYSKNWISPFILPILSSFALVLKLNLPISTQAILYFCSSLSPFIFQIFCTSALPFPLHLEEEKNSSHSVLLLYSAKSVIFQTHLKALIRLVPFPKPLPFEWCPDCYKKPGSFRCFVTCTSNSKFDCSNVFKNNRNFISILLVYRINLRLAFKSIILKW